uniref:C2H2-type domain-containing protein n=1 Tax=Romanomermis culicivorax TaxID=13658 RepID=A0A915IVG6_ROMCU
METFSLFSYCEHQGKNETFFKPVKQTEQDCAVEILGEAESIVSRSSESENTASNVTDSASSTLVANNSALSDFLNFAAYNQFLVAAAAAVAGNVTPHKTCTAQVKTLKATVNVDDVENSPANKANTFNMKLDLASAPSTSGANSATTNAAGSNSLDALSKLSSLVSKVGSNSGAATGLPLYAGSKSTDFHEYFTGIADFGKIANSTAVSVEARHRFCLIMKTCPHALSPSQSGFSTLINGKSMLASPTGNGHHQFGAESSNSTAGASSFNGSALVKNLLDASSLINNGGGANNGAVAAAAAAAAAAGGNVNFQDLWWRFVKREENAEMKRLNEAKQIFTCLQCQASFQTMDQLVKHMEATQHYTNIPKHYSWSLQYARQKMRQMKMKMKYSDKMMYFCFLCQNAFSEPVQVHFNLLHNMHNPAENMKYVQIISSTNGNNINHGNTQNCAESSGSSSSTSTSSSLKNMSKRNANHGNSKQTLNGKHITLTKNANNHHANIKDSKASNKSSALTKEEDKKTKFSENSLSKLQDIVSK